jgi:hypothetical protein
MQCKAILDAVYSWDDMCDVYECVLYALNQVKLVYEVRYEDDKI